MGGRGNSGVRNTASSVNVSRAQIESARIGDKMQVTTMEGIKRVPVTVEYTLQEENLPGYEEKQPVWVPDKSGYSRIRFGENVKDMLNDYNLVSVTMDKSQATKDLSKISASQLIKRYNSMELGRDEEKRVSDELENRGYSYSDGKWKKSGTSKKKIWSM